MQGLPAQHKKRRVFPRSLYANRQDPRTHMTAPVEAWARTAPIQPSERGCVSSAMMSWFILRKWCQASAVRLVVSTAVQLQDGPDFSYCQIQLLYNKCSSRQTFFFFLPSENMNMSIFAFYVSALYSCIDFKEWNMDVCKMKYAEVHLNWAHLMVLGGVSKIASLSS